MKSDIKIGDEINGFSVIDINHIEDEHIEGLYLRHKETGLEVYHMFDPSESENTFAFAFRTLAKNSKGTAHIIEHSVLCGSEKYPLKEPFTNLINQSVHTFLNALTYHEKTVYPASSLVKADFFNIFDVYADAVFFPKLSKQTFMQEGWRLEYDENGGPTIQGVVYNEMKGAYSDYVEPAQNQMIASMFPDTYLAYDSGGNPNDIPSLTYSDFKKFHKKFYKPSNAVLVVHGDVSPEEITKHIEDTLSDRLIKKYGSVKFSDSKKPVITKEMANLLRVEPAESHKTVATSVKFGNAGSDVTLNFYTGLDDQEMELLASVLYDVASPLSKEIKKIQSGAESSLHGKLGAGKDRNIFSIGVKDVSKENETKTLKELYDAIKKVAEEGFSQADVMSSIMKFEISERQKARFWGGTHGLKLVIEAISNWVTGEGLSEGMNNIKIIENLKKNVSKDPEYVNNLYRKVFFDNPNVLEFICRPDDSYTEEMDRVEKDNILKAVEAIEDKDAYVKELDKLYEYQERKETDEEQACIPHLNVSDFSENDIKPTGLIMSVEKGVPCYSSTQPNMSANGITYFDMFFPIDNLTPQERLDFGILKEMLETAETKNESWDKVVSSRLRSVSKLSVGYENCNTHLKFDEQRYKYAGREWMTVSAVFLSEKYKEAQAQIEKFFNETYFNDEEHFRNVFNTIVTNSRDFIPNNDYVIMLRQSMCSSAKAASEELIEGISSYKYMCSIQENLNVKDLMKRFNKLFKKIIRQGVVIYDFGAYAIWNFEKNIVRNCKLHAPKKMRTPSLRKMLRKAYKPELNNADTIYVKANVQVGFASKSFKTDDDFISTSKVSKQIIEGYLNNHQLWEKIRTKNGAYGAWAQLSGSLNKFEMGSYRDPNPIQSLKYMDESLDEISMYEFTREDVDKNIISVFGRYIHPIQYFIRGRTELIRNFRGYSSQDLVKKAQLLLNLRPEDVTREAYEMCLIEDSPDLVFVPNDTELPEDVDFIQL